MNLVEYLKKREKKLLAKIHKKNIYKLLSEKHNYSHQKNEKISREEIFIQGASMDEVFSKASLELRIDSRKVKHRVIKKKKNSWLKKDSQLYEVAFNLLSAIKEGAASDILSEYSFLKNDDDVIEDGYPELNVTRKGKFLIIHSPKKNKKATNLMAVKTMLKEKGIEDVADSTIKALIDKSNGEPLIIGKWEPDVSKDGKVICDISNDLMTATVRVIAPKKDGRFIDKKDIYDALTSKKIKYGVLDKKIDDCIKNKIFNAPFKVAEGLKPINGKDAYIDSKFDLKKELNFDDSEVDKIDFKKMDLITNVRSGNLLAEKKVATKGKHGKNLFNQVVQAKHGKDLVLEGGDNTYIDNSDLLLKSSIDGHVIERDGLIHVVNFFIINGDVGPKTGNIVKMGSVKIIGSVLDGYSVKASGNIEVIKSVGAAYLEATGSIIIKLGVNGKNKAKLSTEKGDIYSKFIQDAKVFCGKNLIVSESIIHSEVTCNASVILQGGKSAIVGGLVMAYEEIRAKTLGAPAEVKTCLEVGIMPLLRSGEIECKRYIEKNQSKVPQLKLDIRALEEKNLDDEKKEKLSLLEKELKEIEKNLIEKKEKLTKIEKAVISYSKEGKITAKKKVYRGVQMKCNLAELSISHEQSASFYKMDPDNNQYVKLYPFIKSAWRWKR